MANIPSRNLESAGLWPKGIDNRRQEDEISSKSLRQAENVDLSRTGMTQRRNGVTLAKAGTNMHSGYATANFPWMLAVDNKALKAFDTTLTGTVLLTPIDEVYPVSYAEINGEVYWSNRLQCGKVTPARENVPWGVQNPWGPPIVASTAAGGLFAGKYQVGVTFMLASGEEGGSTDAVIIDVPEGGGVSLTSIPQPTDLRVVAVRVYMTECNDEVLYWRQDLVPGMTSITLGASVPGKMMETQFCFPMPPGQIVRYGNGRLWVAQDNVVWYSEPQYYGQTRASSNYIVFNERVDMLEYPTEGDGSGLFVAAGKRTYFVLGQNPKDGQLRVVHPFGAVQGSGTLVPGVWFDPQLGSNVAYWTDLNGVPCIGLPTGLVRAVTQDLYMGPVADSAAVLVREQGGVKQVLTNLRGTSRNVAAASDDVVAVITRNGFST